MLSVTEVPLRLRQPKTVHTTVSQPSFPLSFNPRGPVLVYRFRDQVQGTSVPILLYKFCRTLHLGQSETPVTSPILVQTTVPTLDPYSCV